MQKTISINIAGIVFYIEEDGYDKLNAYLKGIQQYFSSYEGSKEIVEDIEARIAEKFWDKQKKEGKQAISLNDVNELIASMGSVSDFAAIEEDEDLATSEPKSEAKSSAETEDTDHTYKYNYKYESKAGNYKYEYKYDSGVKKLYRDERRKLLGGVCAGLAHNFHIDPLWIRLVALTLFLGLSPITESGLSGVIFIIYVACWIAFPANLSLEENDHVKKFYRNPDHKVLGGVVSGVASYTGWDLGLLRFCFVLGIFFFGTGIILYLILWLIAPEAKTLTDKMQMTGEPITLENIESNIKRALNTEDKPENNVTKLVLLPFRVLSQVIETISPATGFLGNVIRFFAGGLMTFIAFVMVVALCIALFAGLAALENSGLIVMGDIPLKMFTKDVSDFLIISIFFLLVTPFIALGILGATILTKRRLINSTVWQSILGVFVISIFATMTASLKYAEKFSKSASIDRVETFNLGTKTPVFKINHPNDDDDNDNQAFKPFIELVGYEGSEIKLEESFKANGSSKVEAENNAKTIKYSVVQKDSSLTFDDRLDFKENTKFRKQRLRMKVLIPIEKPFAMTKDFAYFIENMLDSRYFDDEVFKGSLWKFTKDGNLVCINRTLSDENDNTSENDDNDEFPDHLFVQKLPLTGFENIKVDLGTSVSNVIVHESHDSENGYQVAIAGDQASVDKIKARVKDGTLVIELADGVKEAGIIEIRVTLPKLASISLPNGVGTSYLKDVENDKLKVELGGNQVLKINGKTNELEANLKDVAKLEAYDLESQQAKIQANSNTTAEVQVNQQLDAKSDDFGQIRYRGEPNINKNISGSGMVIKEN
jgi:phage shock protein PspC (stress-responsive transcriptional regulator)